MTKTWCTNCGMCLHYNKDMFDILFSFMIRRKETSKVIEFKDGVYCESCAEKKVRGC